MSDPDFHKFENYVDERIRIEVAGGGTIYADGYRSMQLELHPRCGGQTVILQKVLYVPKLGGNLLVPRQTIKTGNVIHMDTEKVSILETKGNIVVNCPRRGGHLLLIRKEYSRK